MIYVIIFAIGVLFGVAVSRLTLRHKCYGYLRIKRDDIDGGTYLFLEMEKDVRTLKGGYVIFKLHPQDFQ